MEPNLLSRPYPNEDAQVTRSRSALKALISASLVPGASAAEARLTLFPNPPQAETGMAAVGYPRKMSLY